MRLHAHLQMAGNSKFPNTSGTAYDVRRDHDAGVVAKAANSRYYATVAVVVLADYVESLPCISDLYADQSGYDNFDAVIAAAALIDFVMCAWQ